MYFLRVLFTEDVVLMYNIEEIDENLKLSKGRLDYSKMYNLNQFRVVME